MTDLSYNNEHIYSDKKLLLQIGDFIKHQRMQKGMTQNTLAQSAGISRSTLSILEHGGAVSVATLLQVLRILDQLSIMDFFTVHQTISPLALAKLEQQKRQRVKPFKTKKK